MVGKNRIVVKKAVNKQPYIVVKGKNNETIVSSETYRSNQAKDKAIRALKRIVKNAIVDDQTKPKKKKS